MQFVVKKFVIFQKYPFPPLGTFAKKRWWYKLHKCPWYSPDPFPIFPSWGRWLSASIWLFANSCRWTKLSYELSSKIKLEYIINKNSNSEICTYSFIKLLIPYPYIILGPASVSHFSSLLSLCYSSANPTFVSFLSPNPNFSVTISNF